MSHPLIRSCLSLCILLLITYPAITSAQALGAEDDLTFRLSLDGKLLADVAAGSKAAKKGGQASGRIPRHARASCAGPQRIPVDERLAEGYMFRRLWLHATATPITRSLHHCRLLSARGAGATVNGGTPLRKKIHISGKRSVPLLSQCHLGRGIATGQKGRSGTIPSPGRASSRSDVRAVPGEAGAVDGRTG